MRAIQQRDNRAHRQLIDAQFSSVTPENQMKWYALQPDRERFTYGVGLQMHSNLNGVPPTFRDNMRRFEALGLEIHITEADVGLRLPVKDARLRTQAAVYARIVRDCVAVKACESLTFGGFTDGRSWIPETQPGIGAGCSMGTRPEAGVLVGSAGLGG